MTDIEGLIFRLEDWADDQVGGVIAEAVEELRELRKQNKALQTAMDGVSDALDYLHGLTPQQFDALRKDAERFRHLEHDFSVMGANIDGNHAWAYRRNFSLRGPTLRAAIDAAMQKDKP